tara:strand:+ start:552 stop:740 length:189 start_codon:yes stop_codon:yes gene_type:complete
MEGFKDFVREEYSRGESVHRIGVRDMDLPSTSQEHFEESESHLETRTAEGERWIKSGLSPHP